MSRDSGGTFNLAAGNPVVANTTITDTWANDTLGDIADELTDSLSRSGKGAMLADLSMGNFRLKSLPAGTLASPAIQAAATEGIYFPAAKKLGIVVNGQEVLFDGTSGIVISGNFNSAGGVRFSNSSGSTQFWIVSPGATQSSVVITNSSDVSNYGALLLKQEVTTGGATIEQTKAGTGSYGPITFKVNNAVAAILNADGTLTIGTTATGNDQVRLQPGSIEVSNSSTGGFIDLKSSYGEDYDIRLRSNGNTLEITSQSGAGTLTMDGAPFLSATTLGSYLPALRNPTGRAGDRYAIASFTPADAGYPVDGWQTRYTGTTGRVQFGWVEPTNSTTMSGVQITCSTLDSTINATDEAYIAIDVDGLYELLAWDTSAGNQKEISISGQANYQSGTIYPFYVGFGIRGGAWLGTPQAVSASGGFCLTWAANALSGGAAVGTLEVRIALAAGSSTAAFGTTNILASTSNQFYLRDLAVHLGSVAPAQTGLPREVEYLRNLRFYQRFIGGSNHAFVGVGTSTTNIRCVVPLPVKMRSAPTVTKSGNFSTGMVTPTPTTVTATTIGASSTTHFIVDITGTGIVAGQAYVVIPTFDFFCTAE